MKIAIDVEEMEQVTEVCYLGNLVSDDAKYHTEIKKRTAMGKEASIKKRVTKRRTEQGHQEKND